MGIKDLTGKDILNVHVDSLNKVDRRSYWNVTCVCGKQFVVDANRLKQNKVFINCGNNEFHNIITEEEVTDDDSNDNEEESIEEAVEIGRDPLSGSYDVSSGRITLLKQSLIMFKNHPFFGVGRGNIVEYGLREIPGGLRFSDFHNGYVTILVSWGTIGFIIFSSFALMLAIDMCKSLFNMGFNKHYNLVLV